jgi:hypothetical protein
MNDKQAELEVEFKPSPFGSSGGTLGNLDKDPPIKTKLSAGDNSSSDDVIDEDTED